MSAFLDGRGARFGLPICRELEVSASAYWARRVKPPSPWAIRDEVLLNKIRRVHTEAFGIYGQLKVWRQLQREGITVARCTVERLMRQHGIEVIRKGETRRTTIPGATPAPAPDLVRRNFSADRPDKLWLADFTCIRMLGGVELLRGRPRRVQLAAGGRPDNRGIQATTPTWNPGWFTYPVDDRAANA